MKTQRVLDSITVAFFVAAVGLGVIVTHRWPFPVVTTQCQWYDGPAEVGDGPY